MVNRGDRLDLKQEDRTQAEEEVEQVSKERCWHGAYRHAEKARVGIG
jgi:hypothetical protein